MFAPKSKVGKGEPCVCWTWMLHVDACVVCRWRNRGDQ